MSFADPQSVTFASPLPAATISLPRVSVGAGTSQYASDDGLVILSASNSKTNKDRVRRVLRIDHSKISADPFLPSTNVKQSMSCYIVFDIPPAGYSGAEAKAVYTGFKGQFTASTDALITKLLGGES